MAKYNFNNFQIPQSGVSDDGPKGDQQSRGADSKLSNFGALAYGVRSAVDYTMLTHGFKAKDELQNPEVPAFYPTGNAGNWGGAVNNPYVAGSTVKHVRTDEFHVMGLGSRNTEGVAFPGTDVMDTTLVWNTTLSGLTASGVNTASGVALNFPTEGWNTFGGRTGGPFNYVQ